MNLVVELAFFDELAVVLGTGLPIVTESKLVEQPHLAAQEALAPIGPGFLAVLPTTLVGIDREVLGIVGGKLRYFARCDLESGIGSPLGPIGKRQRASLLDPSRWPIHRVPTSLFTDAADPGRSLGAGADDRALVLDVLIDRGPAKAGGAIAAE